MEITRFVMALTHIPTVYNLSASLIAKNASRAFSSSPACKSWLSKLILPFSDKTDTKDYGANPPAANRCFLPIRNDSELNDTLLYSSRTPLLLNFTFRGNTDADLLTGALTRLVQLETEKRINMCDVETDFLETRESMMRFGVKEIPTIVAVRKSLPVDYYTLYDEDKIELNYLRLKAWVEKNADEA